ncbi:MAG: uracil-DNA glycosylase family protein [Tepidisphaerales bacterium]
MHLTQLHADVTACRACPRLAAHARRCRTVASAGWWRPVPGAGEPSAWLWVVGLAPGAKGAGLTGVPFTRDASGVFLRGALQRAGVDEREVYMSNAVRCVPPGNRPSAAEVARCRRFLRQEWELVRSPVVVALGAVAWRAVLDVAGVRPRAAFGHGVRVEAAGRVLLASYHVSPLNVRTGRLTAERFDALLAQACAAREGVPACRAVRSPGGQVAGRSGLRPTPPRMRLT